MTLSPRIPLVGRLLRPGLNNTQRRVERLRAAVDRLISDRAPDLARRPPTRGSRTPLQDAELRYWVDAAAGRAGLPGPLWEVFGRWQRTRLFELADRLGLARGLSPGDPITGAMAQWCAEQRAVEIGPGPHPALAEARWRSAAAIDPLADSYRQEGLIPPHADRVVWVSAPGEAIPLASTSADLVICENCLDHVAVPTAVVGEMRRLLRPGGLAWVLVDVMDAADDLHPHPFSEASAPALFEGGGFEVAWAAVWDGHSHPNARGQWRALLRRK